MFQMYILLFICYETYYRRYGYIFVQENQSSLVCFLYHSSLHMYSSNFYLISCNKYLCIPPRDLRWTPVDRRIWSHPVNSNRWRSVHMVKETESIRWHRSNRWCRRRRRTLGDRCILCRRWRWRIGLPVHRHLGFRIHWRQNTWIKKAILNIDKYN